MQDQGRREKVGRFAEAAADFRGAAALTRNARERLMLLARAAASAGRATPMMS